ncbi:MAG: Gfo/Idh/MocA family oxidoreductase [Abditibacteriales bacterium]|nr:Gfo/Idh/MocA family oxidoreductase [Abditibacteriales bacterium]MDW8364643.1 Gfo/Idh/MocA family oxidoreductase [Abditibacteriales bacterium]
MLRVGFIGAGGNAEGHMRRVKEIEDVEIAAICDVVLERAQAMARAVGGVAYDDYREMLDKEALDAIYISIPPFAHGEVDVLAAQKKAALFIEKPVALDMETGLRIWEAVQQAGIITCVGYQTRYLDAAQRGREFLADKTIGMVVCNRWGGIAGGAEHWWRVMEKSGGQLVEQTTHQVDLMRFLVGEIVEVTARYALRVCADLENFTIPDAQVLTLQFLSGAIGTLTTSCMMTRGGGKSSLDILLRDLRLEWTRDGWKTYPEQVPELAAPPQPRPSIDEVFIHAVRTGDASLIQSDYADALRTLDVTLAANESARTGQPVRTYFAR